MKNSTLVNFDEAQENLSGDLLSSVLLPIPVDKTYNYIIPNNMNISIGDTIEVNFANRKSLGVIWDINKNNGSIPQNKLKPIAKAFDNCPQINKTTRDFITWVAKYTMSPLGQVLKMSLSTPEAFAEEKPIILYKKSSKNHDIKLSTSRKNVLKIIEDNKLYTATELANKAGCGTAVIKAMAEKHLLETEETSAPAPCTNPEHQEIELSNDQMQAATGLIQQINKQEHNVTLLDGVTGSGKTEVYFEAISKVLASDKDAQILVLLPEIALSQQFFDRFQTRFNEAPAVWHSAVSKTKKRKIWRGVAEGKTRVVVGARSALFLPFKNLKLTIIDEEHDPSYKQEDGGAIYHARDMAIVRAKIENAPIILVSATPALETIVNVRQGKYKSVILAGRYGGASMPDTHMINMRETPPPTRLSFLSSKLRQVLTETLEAEEQSLLFLNRRGYAPLTLCRTCGHRLECPSCTAWLVNHRSSNRLQCHHCGYGMIMPKKCPECEAEDSLALCGPGVERLEEEVQSFLPEARTLILSSDILTSETALNLALQKIHDREVDIIIGTQLVAKGHHFPLLTCVGIVDADLGLGGGDLRATERTYQLLHQVSGRAGREEKQGNVYLQSYMHDHPVMEALLAGDSDEFMDIEIEGRKQSNMPPFGKLAGLILSSKNERLLNDFCSHLARTAPRYEQTTILGPAPAPMAIIRDQHRRRFLIKTEKSINIQKLISKWLSLSKCPSQIRIKIDIDPYNFL